MEHALVIGSKAKKHKTCNADLETCSQEAEARNGKTNWRKRENEEDCKNPSSRERRGE